VAVFQNQPQTLVRKATRTTRTATKEADNQEEAIGVVEAEVEEVVVGGEVVAETTEECKKLQLVVVEDR